jgi:hypothetical protein
LQKGVKQVLLRVSFDEFVRLRVVANTQQFKRSKCPKKDLEPSSMYWWPHRVINANFGNFCASTFFLPGLVISGRFSSFLEKRKKKGRESAGFFGQLRAAAHHRDCSN